MAAEADATSRWTGPGITSNDKSGPWLVPLRGAHRRAGYMRLAAHRARPVNHAPPVRDRFDRFGDLVGDRVMEHVSRSRNQPEVAAGNCLVEPDGMVLMIHDPVLGAGHDDHGDPQIVNTVLHADYGRHHGDGVL